MKLLDGKVAIITGAARGIGEAIAEKFADQGAHIAFTYVSDSSAAKAKALEEKLLAKGVKAKAYQSNAGDYPQCEQMVNDVIATFGNIDICVNNAGISKDNLLLRVTPEQWDEVMKAKKGSIINMSSIVGVRGNAGQSSYSASKAGIIGFTKSMAHELGSRNIRCNAIAPGFIETDMTHYLKDGEGASAFLANIPLGRFGTGEEVANTTLFLASDLSSYITGQVISTCGGLNI
jgi:3-oxoacyl-[acyl-carrier protein] reductase